jgi:hypothetical protein
MPQTDKRTPAARMVHIRHRLAILAVEDVLLQSDMHKYQRQMSHHQTVEMILNREGSLHHLSEEINLADYRAYQHTLILIIELVDWPGMSAKRLETRRKYSPAHLRHSDLRCEKANGQDELLGNVAVILLAEDISTIHVPTYVSFHNSDGQRRRLWEAVLDAGHECSSRQWNTYARSPDWDRFIRTGPGYDTVVVRWPNFCKTSY